jgi:HAD superfamily hydrolase (TIGR01484 family)
MAMPLEEQLDSKGHSEAEHLEKLARMRTSPPLLTADLARRDLAEVRLVATDMDGTLTSAGEFTPSLLQAFARLRSHQIEVMIVTGRSAGWVSAVVNYLPVVGAIAENGGLYISKRSPEPVILSDIPRMSRHRDRLAALFKKLKVRCPNLQPSWDNPFRITDWTFDIQGLSEADLAWMQNVCEENTMGFTYSNVQCHLKIKPQNKAAGLRKVLQQQFSSTALKTASETASETALEPSDSTPIASSAVLTVGDSPNDESLFDASQFPRSVGVANVADYLPVLAHVPAYVTASAEGEGFVELVDRLVAAQKSAQKSAL